MTTRTLIAADGTKTIVNLSQAEESERAALSPTPAQILAERRQTAVVERFQLKIAARRLKMLQAIKNAVAAGGDDVKDIWADATVFRRKSKFIGGLPFSAKELDDLFAAAFEIEE
jgi:hypothetical protein